MQNAAHFTSKSFNPYHWWHEITTYLKFNIRLAWKCIWMPLEWKYRKISDNSENKAIILFLLEVEQNVDTTNIGFAIQKFSFLTHILEKDIFSINLYDLISFHMAGFYIEIFICTECSLITHFYWKNSKTYGVQRNIIFAGYFLAWKRSVLAIHSAVFAFIRSFIMKFNRYNN